MCPAEQLKTRIFRHRAQLGATDGLVARTLCDPMAGSCNVLGAWHRMSTLCDLATLDNAETWWCDRVVLTPVSESCTTRSSSGAEPALLQRRSRRRRQLHVRLGCGRAFQRRTCGRNVPVGRPDAAGWLFSFSRTCRIHGDVVRS